MSKHQMQQSYWVFGYGSLIWNPGFDFINNLEAQLLGAHRCLCIYSHHHRGTKKNPGLVFGLRRGGSCLGMAFQIAPKNWQKTIDYLREREQVTKVYKEAMRQIVLKNGQKTCALTYLANESHAQYAGELAIGEQLSLIKNASGVGGKNIEYVINTARHLREMNIKDKRLEKLVGLLNKN